jgi:hypothetical protein
MLVFAAALVAGVPGVAAARESQPRHGSVDRYLRQRTQTIPARPAGAALLAPAIAVVRRLTRRTRWQRAVVDSSAYLLAGVAAALTYERLGGAPSLDTLPQLLLPAVAAGLVFYLHTMPIAAAMAIDARSTPQRVWLDHFRWLWPEFVALGGSACCSRSPITSLA